jgi:hypothetical protein
MKIKIFAVAFAILVTSIAPSHAAQDHECKGSYNSGAGQDQVIDSHCHGGYLLVDASIKVSIPQEGNFLTVEWIKKTSKGFSNVELQLDHSGTAVFVSTSARPDVIRSNYQASMVTSLVPSSVDHACSNSSNSKVSNFVRRGEIQWWYNSTGEPSSLSIYRIGAGFNTWKNQTNRCNSPQFTSILATKYMGRTSNPEAMNGNPPTTDTICGSSTVFDGLNVIGWGLLPPNMIGYTCWTKNLSHLETETDIRFAQNENWWTNETTSGCTNAFDLEDLATHEIGHMIGLGHADDYSSQVMEANAYLCNFRNRQLGQGDMTSLANLYKVVQ